MIFVFAAADSGGSFGFWPSGTGTWAQVIQAGIALLNLAVVCYVFFRTRSDKRWEAKIAVDSFWLQKVIVEPNAKNVDLLHDRVSGLMEKARDSSSQLGRSGAGAPEVDLSLSSHADLVSNATERFRFGIIPLIQVVLDDQFPQSEILPSRTVDDAIDHLEEIATIAIDGFFRDPQNFSELPFEDLAKARTRLLKSIFALHKLASDRKK